MSRTGFEHVTNAVDLSRTSGAHIRGAPPIFNVLLQIIPYTDDPHSRAKDLHDIRWVFGRYEAESDRLFKDAVFDAEPPDVSEANAFLLGRDLRGLATKDDVAYVERFLAHFLLQDEGELAPDDFAGKVFEGRLHASNEASIQRGSH